MCLEHHSMCRLIRRSLLSASFVLIPAGQIYSQDIAEMSKRPGLWPIQLWPLPDERERTPPGRTIDLGGWTYRAVKSPHVSGEVPWKLIVTPAGGKAKLWRKGGSGPSLPIARAQTQALISRATSPPKDAETIPVVEIPQLVWNQRMVSDFHSVVGIHFHEFISDDLARILFTLHKVPADNPDGLPPEPGSYPGRPGTRIEATLLAPVVWSLDQTIAIRVDALQKGLIEGRKQHEIGHAKVSQQVLLAVLRGPQDWNPMQGIGRRSRLDYFWRREQIGRSWAEYHHGIGKLLALRTSIVLVPPTRWSLLLPIPPERVTQKHIQMFNDAIVKLGPQFTIADKRAQNLFHSHNGEYENPGAR